MTILAYIAEIDVDAYISQGWTAVRLQGHHGARGHLYAKARTFLACLTI